MPESGTFVLKSGRWRWHVEESSHGEVMELIDPGEPMNKMVVPLPFTWRTLPEDEIRDIVRRPDMRLWHDGSVFWRVSAVGPGTRFDYQLSKRHLVFDSKQVWAGLVEFPEGELGDLSEYELQRLRDNMRDFGGRRRHFRRISAR